MNPQTVPKMPVLIRQIVFWFLLWIPSLLLSQKPELVVPIGHTSGIDLGLFSPSGQFVLTGSRDETAKLWQTKSGQLIASLEGHSGTIYAIDFSADEKYILTGSGDGKIKLWETSSGQQLHTANAHAKAVTSAQFSPPCPSNQNCPFGNGIYFLSGGGDNTAKLWRTDTQELVHTFTGHQDFIKAVAFSPNSYFVLTASQDNTARVWDTQSGQLLHELKDHSAPITAIDISPDGQLLLTASLDSTINIWDSTNGQLLHSLQEDQGKIEDAVFSPHGKYILSGGSDGKVRYWNSLTGQLIHSLSGHAKVVNTVAFSPDGKWLLSGSNDYMAKVWNAKTGKLQYNLEGHGNLISDVAFAPNGQIILTAGYDYAARLWDLQSGKGLHELKGFTSVVNGVAFSRNYQSNRHSITTERAYLATAGDDRTVKVWDISNGQIRQSLSGHREAVTALSTAPNGHLASASRDETAKLWDPFSGELVHTLQGHTDGLTSIAFSPNGQQLLSSSYDKTARLWDVQKRDTVRTLTGHDSPVYAAAFSPTGNSVLTGGYDRTARVWVKPDWGLDKPLWGQLDRVTALTYDTSGQKAITGGYDNTARIWELRSGRQLDSLVGHQDHIQDIKCSPNGRWIATAGKDHSINIWDAQTYQLRHTLTGHRLAVNSLDFSPDGNLLLSGSEDNTVKIWNPEKPVALATLIAVGEKDWVVTTPEGHFDASQNAMALMHYVVNYQGQWEVIDLDQLKSRYYEPGLLSKILGYSDESIRPVQDFNQVELYPEVTHFKFKNDSIWIGLKARNGGVGKISLFINGKEIEEDARTKAEDLSRLNSEHLFRYPLQSYQKKFFYQSSDSTNILSVRVHNQEDWLKSKADTLHYSLPALLSKGKNTNGVTKPSSNVLPKLHILCIGTSDYTGSKLDLHYADQDAAALAIALTTIGTAQFSAESVNAFCLTTSKEDSTMLAGKRVSWGFASRKNIAAALAKISRAAKAEDVLVLYLSGHGLAYGGAEKSQFHYLTQGIANDDLSDTRIREQFTVSSQDLTRWMNIIPALKQILIIDACNSGQAIQDLRAKKLNSSQIRALDRMKDRTGMFILSGSTADKMSYETSEFGQGLLTYALLQGILGDAIEERVVNNRMTRYIDVMKLFQYAKDKVETLARSINAIQTPMLGFPSNGGSIDIGILQDKIDIPKLTKIPLVSRSVFINEQTYRDDALLAKQLEILLRDNANQGRGAELIYTDVFEYPSAFSLGGIYRLEDGEIRIDCKLFKGKKELATIEIPTSDDPEEIAMYLFEELLFTLSTLNDQNDH
mgnify:CR=1 FL=1